MEKKKVSYRIIRNMVEKGKYSPFYWKKISRTWPIYEDEEVLSLLAFVLLKRAEKGKFCSELYDIVEFVLDHCDGLTEEQEEKLKRKFGVRCY
ncbi:MAG: hypothetical protein N3D17_07735 [bacterium]|nr:hypothetical protein [bacterium]